MTEIHVKLEKPRTRKSPSMVTISGTGHRPKYFPCKYDEKDDWYVNLYRDLKNALILTSPKAIISGVAIGWDTMLALAAIELQIPFKAYVPFPDQGSNWPKKSQDRYKEILGKAEEIVVCSDHYHKQCFFKRDEMMINDSDEVFALLNPKAETGGTYYTVKYAEKQKKPVFNFWRDNPDCQIDLLSSSMCIEGTKSCITEHEKIQEKR